MRAVHRSHTYNEKTVFFVLMICDIGINYNIFRYDLELHMVHESADGKVAVISIMYKIGRPDSFLSSVS